MKNIAIRSISNIKSFQNMPENKKEWWMGLAKELQKDIEFDEQDVK